MVCQRNVSQITALADLDFESIIPIINAKLDPNITRLVMLINL